MLKGGGWCSGGDPVDVPAKIIHLVSKNDYNKRGFEAQFGVSNTDIWEFRAMCFANLVCGRGRVSTAP